MSSLLHRFRRPRTEDPALHSTQIYRWPASLARMHHYGLVAGILMVVAGLGLLARAHANGSTEQLTAGLLLEVFGFMAIVTLGLMHTCIAREVRFTLDSLVIRQTWRSELVLPYSRYDLDWMADRGANGHARIIIFHPHRGCTVINPPDWFHEALAEVARIQEEEGWYEAEGLPRRTTSQPLAETWH